MSEPRTVVTYDSQLVLLPCGWTWEQLQGGFAGENVQAIIDGGIVAYVLSRGGMIVLDGGDQTPP